MALETRFFFLVLLTTILVFRVLNLKFECLNQEDAHSDLPHIVQLDTTKPKTTSLEDLWVGDIGEAKPLNKKITVVVITYCQGDLGWLDGFLAGHEIHQHLLISKCGNQIPTGNWRKKAKVFEEQNVGGNDQSVAAVLSNVTSGKGTSDVYYFL